MSKRNSAPGSESVDPPLVGTDQMQIKCKSKYEAKYEAVVASDGGRSRGDGRVGRPGGVLAQVQKRGRMLHARYGVCLGGGAAVTGAFDRIRHVHRITHGMRGRSPG